MMAEAGGTLPSDPTFSLLSPRRRIDSVIPRSSLVEKLDRHPNLREWTSKKPCPSPRHRIYDRSVVSIHQYQAMIAP